MKIIDSSFAFEDDVDSQKIMKIIEKAGRTCYKSENNITGNSAEKFIKGIIKRGHESVLEHEKITVRIICDRGVSHELVRHRIASFSQESTRYCNYTNDKFGNELTFIEPSWTKNKDDERYIIWENTMKILECNYLYMLKNGATPEQARSILPNSLKTEIVVTMNLREWRHFLKLRTNIAAHPDMRNIAFKILKAFKEKLPIIFEDIEVEE